MQRGLHPSVGARFGGAGQTMKSVPCSVLGIDVGGTKIAGGVVCFPEGRVSTQELCFCFAFFSDFCIFLYVTVGTGISSCLMIDGEPFVGARGATGTMASSPMSWSCENCGHTTQRTLEEIASGPGLIARFNQLRPGAAKSGPDVLTAGANGDADALNVLRTAGEALGSTVGLLVNVLDPEAVIIGGGLGLSAGCYWGSFNASTRRHIWSEIHRSLPILQASTGQAAGIIGAAAAWEKGSGRRFGVSPP